MEVINRAAITNQLAKEAIRILNEQVKALELQIAKSELALVVIRNT